jgi:hypothetical protein
MGAEEPPAQSLPNDREDTGVPAFARQRTSEAAKPVTETAERATTSAGNSIDDVKSTLAEMRMGCSGVLQDVPSTHGPGRCRRSPLPRGSGSSFDGSPRVPLARHPVRR